MIDLVGILNSAIDVLDHAVRVILGILGKDLTVALLIGELFSGLSTHFLKATPKLINSPCRIFLTRLWAVSAAFVPTFLLYQPADLSKRLLMALVAGFAAPVLYKVTVWLVGKYSPAARANLSGDPQHSIQRDYNVPPKY